VLIIHANVHFIIKCVYHGFEKYFLKAIVIADKLTVLKSNVNNSGTMDLN